jgi:penicillin amidase
VLAETDVAAIFGSVFAQAEDNFPAIEAAYLRVLGRLAEKEGAQAVWSDLVVRALELPRLSEEEYRRADSKSAALCEAAAAGLNLYMKNRGVRRSAIRQFLPWHVLALYRMLHLTAFHALGVEPGEIAEALDWIEPGTVRGLWVPKRAAMTAPSSASVALAIGPAKSANHTAMLLSVSHVEFGSLYEIHLASKEGLNFTGTGFWGMPVPLLGMNPRLGWGLTASRPPVADLYAEAFDSAGRWYRHGKMRRRAEDWADALFIRTPAGLERREVRFRKTDHGPVVAMRYGLPIAARVAHLAEGGLMQQLLEMAKCSSFRRFKAALSRRALISHNVMYADARGNIFYVYNAAVPRRSCSVPACSILDGSDPAADWRGYHALSELPQVRNPRCGFLQNCNSSPFLTAAAGNPNPKRFPAYLNMEADNLQARILRGVAAATRCFSLDDLAQLAFDTRVYQAPEAIAGIAAEWRAMREQQPARARPIRRAVAMLTGWDCRSSAKSVAMTIFTAWLEARASLNSAVSGDWPAITALECAIEQLKWRWGKWKVPWGEINRLQRARAPGIYTAEHGSLAIAGGPRASGIQFVFESAAIPGHLRRYGVFGNAYVFAAEFGKNVSARSISVFGQSSDWRSPHFFDQASLYRRGRLKPIQPDLAEIETRHERAYSPA